MESRHANPAVIGCILAPFLVLALYVAGYFGQCGTGTISEGDVPVGLIRTYRFPGAEAIYEPAGYVEEMLTGNWIMIVELPPRDETSITPTVAECNH
jgi:hypothetical protein